MEDHQQGREGGRIGGKVKGIRSLIGRYNIDRERLRIYGKWKSQRTYM